MTREEKEQRIIRCSNRVKRLTAFAEVVSTWNDLDATMTLAFRTVGEVVKANRIAQQPTEDMKHQNPRFPEGGLFCAGGFDSNGTKVQTKTTEPCSIAAKFKAIADHANAINDIIKNAPE